MLRCKYDHCQYPNCNGENCGLDHDALIKMLIQENRELRDYQRDLRKTLISQINCLDRIARVYLQEPDYEPVCPYGNTDCVCDPAYIRATHPEWWIELGRPTVCETGEEAIRKGCDWCGSYDDEDK